MLHPQGTLRSGWDFVIFLFLLYVMMSVPVRAGFDDMFFDDYYIELVMDSVFLVDIMLNFRTGFVDPKSKVVLDPWKSAKNYMSFW